MFLTKKYRLLLILVLPVMLLTGCYDMTVEVTGLPANTPPSDDIYISGNFNNWDPGDSKYILRLNSDSVYEVHLPKGIGEVEYKFTRGDWSTVEKDRCGFEINNRVAYYGKKPVFKDTIASWNDLPKPGCPSFTIVIDSLPENTPPDAVLYLASNLNDWNPGSRYWMFSQGADGKYYIDVPRPGHDDIYYKITRGSWYTVESAPNGWDIDNRVYRGPAGKEIGITIERWKDR